MVIHSNFKVSWRSLSYVRPLISHLYSYKNIGRDIFVIFADLRWGVIFFVDINAIVVHHYILSFHKVI